LYVLFQNQTRELKAVTAVQIGHGPANHTAFEDGEHGCHEHKNIAKYKLWYRFEIAVRKPPYHDTYDTVLETSDQDCHLMFTFLFPHHSHEAQALTLVEPQCNPNIQVARRTIGCLCLKLAPRRWLFGVFYCFQTILGRSLGLI